MLNLKRILRYRVHHFSGVECGILLSLRGRGSFLGWLCMPCPYTLDRLWLQDKRFIVHGWLVEQCHWLTFPGRRLRS